MTTLSSERVDSVVVLSIRMNTTARMSPHAVQALIAGVVEYVAVGVCLTYTRFVPLDRGPDGSAVPIPKPAVMHLGDEPSKLLLANGLGRGYGEGDSVAFVPNSLVQQTVNSENVTLVVTESLLRVRRISYANPLEAILEIGIPFVAGGGLLAFLQWATTMRAVKRKIEGEAAAIGIANELAIAQVSRDSKEAAVRLANARAQKELLQSQHQTEEANARLLAAQAEAIELDNLRKRMLVAQELEDYLQQHPDLRQWTEAQLVALLRTPSTLMSVEAAALLKPRVELVADDPYEGNG